MAELNWDVAMNLAARLLTIGHPFHPAAIQATAQDLVNCCRGSIRGQVIETPEQQALRLVERIRTEWDHWPQRGGTRQLIALAHEMLGDPRKQPAGNEYVPLGPKPAILCADCADYGWRQVGNRYEYCHCASAEALKIEDPGLIDAFNAHPNCAPRGRFQPAGGAIPSWMSRSEVDRELKRRERERKKLSRRMMGGSNR